MLVDTHCHLDFDWFDGDRDVVVERARQAGVTRIVVPAIDLNGCRVVLDLAERYECVFAAVGVHPNSTAGWTESDIDALRSFAAHEKVVAIGEIGLDYYRDRSPKQQQQLALMQQLALAADLDLPVILHNRDASEDLIRTLSTAENSKRPGPGVLHSFSSTWETAAAALNLGYYVGFTGPVTYRKADDLREIVARVPGERILVETDAPFLAPQSVRGKRNEPAYVSQIAERIAEVRGETLEMIARSTTENAVRLFGERLQ